MNDVLAKIIEAGKAIIPAMVPGAGAALAAGKAIAEAIEAGRDLLTPGDQSAADETLAELQQRVNAHFDDTIAKLRGED